MAKPKEIRWRIDGGKQIRVKFAFEGGPTLVAGRKVRDLYNAAWMRSKGNLLSQTVDFLGIISHEVPEEVRQLQGKVDAEPAKIRLVRKRCGVRRGEVELPYLQQEGSDVRIRWDSSSQQPELSAGL